MYRRLQCGQHSRRRYKHAYEDRQGESFKFIYNRKASRDRGDFFSRPGPQVEPARVLPVSVSNSESAIIYFWQVTIAPFRFTISNDLDPFGHRPLGSFEPI